jgi:hypothetical protein
VTKEYLPVLVFGQWYDCAMLLHEVEQVVVLLFGTIADVDLLGLAQVDVFFDVGSHFGGKALQIAIDHTDPLQVIEEAHVGVAGLFGEAADFG